MPEDTVIFRKGQSSNLPVSIDSGQILFEVDTGRLYIDDENKRTQINKVDYPTKVLTSVEYDQLTEEEKHADIVYIIKDSDSDAQILIDDEPIAGSNNLITSGGTYTAINELQTRVDELENEIQSHQLLWGIM